jgi:DHA3 family macrolide efflux protein-like MFS transporter
MRLDFDFIDKTTEQESSRMNTKPPADSGRQRGWQGPFFTIWTGQAFSLLGSQLVQFALIWWLTKTTGSATVLATASLVGLLPQVFLGPIIGALVDRWNRRLTMIAADSLIALASLVLAFLFYQGAAEIWHVYLLMFVRAVASGFHWPAMQASTSLMVPKEHLTRIQGFNQLLNGGMNIIAAPLGALLLDLLPIQGILGVDVGTALLAILPLFFIPIPQPERTLDREAAGGEKPSVWQDIKAGLRYVWSWPALVLILLMAMVINFSLNPAFSLLPLLVSEHFNGQSWHFATLQSLLGIGMIAGGLVLGAWGGFRRRLYTSFAGLVAVGLGCLAIGLAPSTAFWLAAGAMLVMGFALPIVNGPLLASVQAAVHPEMQGRVFTLITSGASAMTPLGMIIAGPVSDAFGVQTWFLLGGVVTALMGITGFFVPILAQFEEGRGSPTGQTSAETGEESLTSGLASTAGD